jgi:hypothetical protein
LSYNRFGGNTRGFAALIQTLWKSLGPQMTQRSRSRLEHGGNAICVRSI